MTREAEESLIKFHIVPIRNWVFPTFFIYCLPNIILFCSLPANLVISLVFISLVSKDMTLSSTKWSNFELEFEQRLPTKGTVFHIFYSPFPWVQIEFQDLYMK